MNRKVVLARLKVISYAAGKAYIALAKGDSAAYLNELAYIEKNIADIYAEHGLSALRGHFSEAAGLPPSPAAGPSAGTHK